MKNICILGAGLVGSLLAIYLKRRGYNVSIYEKRSDIRRASHKGGRSINLALSDRGLKALEQVGLKKLIEKNVIPMKGRMVHDLHGCTRFLPYGKEGQAINSVSRSRLNEILMDEAEKEGARIFFTHSCTGVDLEETSAFFSTEGKETTVKADLIIGADGAFSALRNVMLKTDRFNYTQHYLEHGYKELNIPPLNDGNFAMPPDALHIWPRKEYMLIALPNLDKSFTCTLFFPFEGKDSFSSLNDRQKVIDFFSTVFPDALQLMPTLTQDFFDNPTSSLVTIKSNPWYRNNCLLIGDAAHAIVPFYGQGMNAGFEDCYVLNTLLNKYKDNWNEVIPAFQDSRKPNADAIAELAVKNFYEMRDLVADPKFILRKKIESILAERYPELWTPLYTMVTFSDIPYSTALEEGNLQEKFMNSLMANHHYSDTELLSLDFEQVINKYLAFRKEGNNGS